MALQHLRSSTANKRPVATSLADGQIALNTNAASPGIFFTNSSNVLTKVGPIQIGTSAPNSSPAGSSGNAVGEQWLDTSGSTVVLKVWDGSAWQQQNKFAAVAGTAAAPSYSFSGDSNTGIYSPGADQVAISTNGTGRLFVDASGNVGFGAAPTTRLEVARLGATWTGAASVTGTAFFTHNGNNSASSPNYVQISAGNATEAGIYLGDSDSNGPGRILYDHSSDSLRFHVNQNERLRINSAGLVGIGTSSPVAPLHVVTTSAAYTTSMLAIGEQSNATGKQLYLGMHTTDAKGYIQSAHWGTAYKELLLNPNGGNVGIGTTSPAALLSLDNATVSDFRQSVAGTLQANIYSSSSDVNVFAVQANPLRFGTSNTERLRITSAGFVGIGTSSPNTELNVVGTIRAHAAVGSDRYIEMTPAGGISYITASSASTYPVISFRQVGSSPVREAMRIDADGRLGVGTTSPGAELQVNGNIRTSGAGGTGYELNDANTKISIPAANSIAFATSALERVRIDNSGRLLVGTSSALTVDGNAGVQKLQIAGTVGDASLSISRFVNAVNGSDLTLAKSRGASVGTNTVVAAADTLGSIRFTGADGTGFIEAVRIRAEVDGTPGTNDMPGRLVFSTTADGASSPTERLRIDSSGRVGIGTTSPTGTLQIQPANSNTPASALVVRQNNGADTSQNTFSIEIDPVNNVSRLISTGTTSPQMSFYTGASERARIDSSGRLLVGTSSARSNYYSSVTPGGLQSETGSLAVFQNSNNTTGSALYVGKSRGTTANSNTVVQADDQLGALVFFGADGTNVWPGAQITALVDGTPGANDMPGRLVFSTTADGASSPTERMRISNDGRITIADAPANSVQAGLYVKNTNRSQAIYGWVDGAGTTYGGLFQASSGNSTQYGVYGYVATTSTYSSGGALFYSINSNTYALLGYWSGSAYWSLLGNGAIGGTAFTNVSDSRLKDVDSDLTGCLDKLANIQPVKYTWKENSQQRRSVGDRMEIGLLAEEVQAQFPELVSEMEWNEITGANPETLNEQLGTTLGVDYGRMTAVLVQALNEAKARIETLEAKVAALENA